MPQRREAGSATAARTLQSSGQAPVRAMEGKAQHEEALVRQDDAQRHQAITQGLQMEQQGQQHEQQMKLQAADRDLEYDSEKGIYRPSMARQERQKAETEAIRARGDAAQRQAAMSEAKLNLEKQKVATQKQQFEREQATRETTARTGWENMLISQQRETRLTNEARMKGGEEAQKRIDERVKKHESNIKSINGRIDRVKFKQMDAKEAMNSPIQQMLMQQNPEYAATIQRINQGEGTEDDYSRMLQGLEAERDRAFIAMTAETGTIATHNIDTPVMRKYILFRHGIKSSLNQITQAQMRVMQGMGIDMQGLYGGVEEREKMLNRMSAEQFMETEFLNSERAVLDELLRANQSNVDTGGAPPAVTGGAGELERRRAERGGTSIPKPGAFSATPDFHGAGEDWSKVR